MGAPRYTREIAVSDDDKVFVKILRESNTEVVIGAEGFFAITMDDPGDITGNAFAVAINDRGQHALWPASLAMAAGWRRESAAMSRQACLDAIAAGWPDIAPAGAHGAGGRGAAFVHERFAEQASRRPDAAAIIGLEGWDTFHHISHPQGAVIAMVLFAAGITWLSRRGARAPAIFLGVLFALELILNFTIFGVLSDLQHQGSWTDFSTGLGYTAASLAGVSACPALTAARPRADHNAGN